MMARRSGGFRDESGAVAVLVALALIVLLGFAAIAVDVGALAAEKRKLSTAADAAALAGAQELPDQNRARQAAKTYAQHNGFQIQDGDISFENNDRRIVVSVSNTVDNIFGKVIGIATSNVGASAAAEKTGDPYWDLNPAIASYKQGPSGEVEIWNCVHLSGDSDILVHSNNKLEIKDGVTSAVAVYATAYTTIEDKANILTESRTGVLRDPPLTTEQIAELKAMAQGAPAGELRYHVGKLELGSGQSRQWAGGVVFIDGNVQLDGGRFLGGAFIIVTGKVELKGGAVVEGTIYALKDVEFKQSSYVAGAVHSLEKVETKDASSIDIVFDSSVYDFIKGFTAKGVRLVR